LGIAALLQLAEHWRAGGAGLFFSGAIDLESEGPFAGAKLHMGYGGLIVERTLSNLPLSSSPSSLTGRVLWGLGNASVRDPITRVRFLSDNFFVAEPSLILAAQLHSLVSAGVLAAYRIALGVQDLDRVDGAQLRGWSVGLSLKVGPF
jgi:hypothetical protein